MKKIMALLLMCALLLMPVSCATEQDGGTSTPDKEQGETAEKPKEENKEPSFNTVVEFDNLEITLSDKINFVKLDNMFSDKNGAEVVEIPATIKNVGDETGGLNIFYYKFFGPSGTELDNVSAYFDNDHMTAGELMPGAEQQTYFHVPYEGDGDYYMMLQMLIGDSIKIKLPVKKTEGAQ